MLNKKILVWFRNDLRLHDNEVLIEAIEKADQILPVYFFDPRHYLPTHFNTLKTGYLRARFLIESVKELRNSFKQYGGDLLVKVGKPEEMLPLLVQAYDITEVYHHREVAHEETNISSLAEDALWKLKINLKHFIGHTLYNKEDLPFPIKDIPDSFSKFRKKTEREALVKDCVLSPEHIRFVEVEDYGEVPTLEALFSEDINFVDSHCFIGGEKAGINQLHLLCQQEIETESSQPGLCPPDVLSPWLALGCISPRRVYNEIFNKAKKKDQVQIFNKVIMGLMWRDYFRFMFKKHGNNFFKLSGFLETVPYVVVHNPDLFQKWKHGITGQYEVDAVMQKLNTTGYIDALSRNLTLTYLIEVLQLDWRFGAAYFEEALIDYAPASNWGNWAAFAGVGNDKTFKLPPNFETQLKQFVKVHSGMTSVI